MPGPEYPHSRESYEDLFDSFERDCLFSSMRSDELRERAEELRTLAHAQGKPSGPAEFFEAVVQHEGANALDGAFRKAIARQVGGTEQMFTMTPDALQGAFTAFARRTELESAEVVALDGYARADDERWTGRWISNVDARLLAFDLRHRQAVRMPDAAERKRALEDIDRRFGDAVDNVADAGKRSEYQLVWLMQRLTRLQGRDHLIEMTHALPRDDMAFGVDAYLVIGGDRFRLNIKALSRDTYRSAYNENIVKKGRGRALSASAVLVLLPFEELRDVFSVARRGAAPRPASIRMVLAAVAEGLPERFRTPILDLAPARPRQSSTDHPKRLTEGYLQRHLTVDVLRRFQCIGQAERPDIDRILDLQRRFLAAAQGILRTVHDFDQPTEEMIERIRQAIGER